MQVNHETEEDVEKQIEELQRKKRNFEIKRERQAALNAQAREKTLIEASPVKAPPPAAIPERLRALSPPRRPSFVPTKTLLSKPTPAPPNNSFKSTIKHGASWTSTPQQSAVAGPSRLSSGIMSRAAEQDQDQDGTEVSSGQRKKGKQPQRDEWTMRLIESFEFGPKEFKKDPEGKDDWMAVEPNSNIRLKSRCTSHFQVQANLTMRFYITPSQLYSIVTLSRDRTHLEVPVDGPWVTIMVVGGSRLLRTKGDGRALSPESQKRLEKKLKRKEEKRKLAETQEAEERDGVAPKRQKMLVDVSDEDDDDEDGDRGRQPSNNTGWKAGPRNFVRFVLTSLPSRRKNEAGGDSILNMLLFESDGVKTELGDRGEKTYKGGSKGAYEKWWKLEVGDVIGIVDPKVLKPIGKGGPSGLKNPLALTVDGPGNIFRIGKSRDIAVCQTIKKDGERCDDFVDLRYSKNCEYHIENAVKGLRGGRAEFASSTGGFEMGVRFNKSGGDKSGLKPRDGSMGYYSSSRTENDAGGQLFVVGGSVISDKKMGAFNQEFVGEKLGREKDRSLKRRREQREADVELGRLLDGEGAAGTTGGRYLQAARKLQGAVTENVAPATPLARPFSSEAVKRIGFNPAILNADDRAGPKVTGLGPLKRADAPVQLGKLPGPRDRSSIKVPTKVPAHMNPGAAAVPAEEKDDGEGFVDLDSD